MTLYEKMHTSMRKYVTRNWGKCYSDNRGQNSWDTFQILSKMPYFPIPRPPEQCWKPFFVCKRCLRCEGCYIKNNNIVPGEGVVITQCWIGVSALFSKCVYWRQCLNEFCPGLSIYKKVKVLSLSTAIFLKIL